MFFCLTNFTWKNCLDSTPIGSANQPYGDFSEVLTRRTKGREGRKLAVPTVSICHKVKSSRRYFPIHEDFDRAFANKYQAKCQLVTLLLCLELALLQQYEFRQKEQLGGS